MPQGSRFVCFNGRFIKENDFTVERNNRAFKYADGFFETMHYGFGEIQLYNQHIKRISKALKTLKMKSFILNQPKMLLDEIVHLNNANHYFKGARVRISVFRSGSGLYKPKTQEASYLIESSPLENDRYPINKKGIRIGLYKEFPKSQSVFNQFKIIASPIPVLASIELGDNDDLFLTNEQGHIIESTHSNVFFIKGKTIYTPNINSGCLHGIMRQQVIEALKNSSFKLIDNQAILEKDIINFDEIFLTNAIRGIQWGGAYQNKRYDYKVTHEIRQNLMEKILGKY